MHRMILVIAAFLVAGCIPATYGNFGNFGNQDLSMQLAQQTLAPGKSTKQDVIAAFGEPATISRYATGQAAPKEGTREQLNYVRMTRDGFVTTNLTTLTVFLDAQGVVLDYVTSEQK